MSREEIKGIAETDPLSRCRQDSLDELGSNRGVNEETLTHGAALTRAQIRGLEGRVCVELKVGVLQNDHRTVAAELKETESCRPSVRLPADLWRPNRRSRRHRRPHARPRRHLRSPRTQEGS